MRPATTSAPSVSLIRAAVSLSTLSPTMCPLTSFIALNLSISSTPSASDEPSLFALSSVFDSTSKKPRRLYNLVRES